MTRCNFILGVMRQDHAQSISVSSLHERNDTMSLDGFGRKALNSIDFISLHAFRDFVLPH
eukprot:3729207-Amphidinium_carterae.1